VIKTQEAETAADISDSDCGKKKGGTRREGGCATLWLLDVDEGGKRKWSNSQKCGTEKRLRTFWGAEGGKKTAREGISMWKKPKKELLEGTAKKGRSEAGPKRRGGKGRKSREGIVERETWKAT